MSPPGPARPAGTRSVVWGILRNPAYAGTAVFGKTQVLREPPGLNRRARLEGRTTPRASKTVDRPRGDWIEIPVPAIVTTETFERAARRLEDNKRFAARNTKIPSLLQGLAACPPCGPAKRACAARPAPSTPSSPTATPTSSSPTTWKASSPSSAATPRTRARAAAARQGRPHRTREDHHPAPHPHPGTHHQRSRTRQRRHGG